MKPAMATSADANASKLVMASASAEASPPDFFFSLSKYARIGAK